MLRIVNLVSGLALILGLLVINPGDSNAAEAECSSGMNFCSTACPSRPDLFCRGYGCSGSSGCLAAPCGGLPYAIICGPS